jgi:two-component system, chemotaxis family, chemotaxis protein CheY
MTPLGAKSSAKDHAARLAQIGVLIADEDRRIALIVRSVLESLGFYIIHLVPDGQQALEKLRAEKIDMVITDWQMSPMNGISLVKYLRTAEDSPNRFIPIIMLTGNADRHHVEAARDIGVTEFVVKPFSARTLCDRIVLLIDNPRSFIMSGRFTGPDRRRRSGTPPDGREKRK